MELNKYSMLSSERADGSNKFNENKFVFNHPFTHDECFNRLVKEAEKYNNGIIVAFDFDHTIFNYREYGDKLEEIVKDNKAEEAAYMCVVELLKAVNSLVLIILL